MFDDFLNPFQSNEHYSNLQIGHYIYKDIDQVKANSIVLISCPQIVNENEKFTSQNFLIKEEFYKFSAGNWQLPIFDLGEILPGSSAQDTAFALQSIIKFCLERKAFPIVLGGSMELLYYLYRSFSKDKALNVVTIDSEIQLEIYEGDLTEENYIFRIINEEPNQLFNFSNLGYQSYLTSYKIHDTLQALDFEAHRLGDLIVDLKEAEPVIRVADLVGLNLNSIQTSNSNFNTKPNPNGFSNREICTLARYIGVSNQMKASLIANFLDSKNDALLVAQIIWYIIEGLNTKNSYQESSDNYINYNVLISDSEIVFVKDKLIDKWWIKLNLEKNETYSKLIPCSYNDYLNAVSGEMPERYLIALRKFL